MNYLLQVSDATGSHMVVLSLGEEKVRSTAIDLVFDLLGAEDPQELLKNGTLTDGLVDDYKALQSVIFDRDSEGLFIRDDVTILANGAGLDPDKSMAGAFLPAQKEGIDYRRCELVIGNGSVTAGTGQHGSIAELGRLLFVSQLASGAQVDVTKDCPELMDIIAWAEKEGYIEIDVKRAAYKLSARGERLHASYMEEAQSLIRRYDIFGDVDIDSAGNAHFDTGLGRDIRVAVYETEGVDPYRARFLLGLSDGEWKDLENWIEVCESEKWYQEIFQVVDSAPSVDDVGKSTLKSVIDQGRARLRQESNL